jgi:hypothetical protein
MEDLAGTVLSVKASPIGQVFTVGDDEIRLRTSAFK